MIRGMSILYEQLEHVFNVDSVVLQSLIGIAAPSRNLYRAIGDLCVDQLISLRHRGAFSTVAQTFNLCCEKVRVSGNDMVQSLIPKWYQVSTVSGYVVSAQGLQVQVALLQIDEQANRLTRRSAGLPAMFAALLSPADKELFSVAVGDLMRIAHRPTTDARVDEALEAKLPQVHALNCLKDIMTHSRFSVVITQHIEAMLELAANSLSSRIWAVRNCGLMLLRACINRVDIYTTSQMLIPDDQSQEKADNDSPTMIALRLLTRGENESAHLHDDPHREAEHVFAGLDLFAYANPTAAVTEQATALVFRHLSHPVWAIRDHAARLLAIRMLSRLGSPIEAALGLIANLRHCGSGNAMHGRLLCFRYLMEAAWDTSTGSELHSLIAALDQQSTLPEDLVVPHSPYIVAAWLDILNDAAATILYRKCNFGLFEVYSIRNIKRRLESSRPSNAIFNSYVVPRYILLQVYDFLTANQDMPTKAEQIAALVDKLIANPESLSFVLDTIVLKHHQHRSSDALALFLTGVLKEHYGGPIFPPNVLERLLTCLTQSLEHSPDLPSDVLQTLVNYTDLSQLQTPRELGNAAVKLQATLLARTAMTPQYRLEEWLDIVQESASDEIDFPTRLAAASAVSIYLDNLGESDFSTESPRMRLSVLLVLYDLLNDGDEEVRSEAIHATQALNLRPETAMENLEYCALATREQIVSLLLLQFSGTPDLTEAALYNVIRLGQNLSGPRRWGTGLKALLDVSVSARVRRISQTKNDLFAEERQNLYIDDMQEIIAWTEVLCHENVSSLTPDVVQQLERWTVEGLDEAVLQLDADSKAIVGHALSRASGRPDGEVELHHGSSRSSSHPEALTGYPLGITYNHDILVMLMQITSLAGVLHQQLKSSTTEILLWSLGRILEISNKSRLNPVFLAAVECALRDR